MKQVKKSQRDGLGFHSRWGVERYRGVDARIAEAVSKLGTQKVGFKPKSYLTTQIEGNCGLNEGIDELLRLITGTGSPTAWTNAVAYLGVGESSTAADATQTGLLGSTKTYKAMDAGFPTVLTQVGTWKSLFGLTDANYAWYEYTLVNASTDAGKNLNRKVSSQGTKPDTEAWALSLTITVA